MYLFVDPNWPQKVRQVILWSSGTKLSFFGLQLKKVCETLIYSVCHGLRLKSEIIIFKSLLTTFKPSVVLRHLSLNPYNQVFCSNCCTDYEQAFCTKLQCNSNYISYYILLTYWKRSLSNLDTIFSIKLFLQSRQSFNSLSKELFCTHLIIENVKWPRYVKKS